MTREDWFEGLVAVAIVALLAACLLTMVIL